ncbi:MAG: FHA domain-containing protein [Saccharofermentanales bacterium]|jgi:hypothetical protein
MNPYICLDIIKTEQMQESELLHLLQLNFDFSHNFVKISDSKNQLHYLLFNMPFNDTTIFNWSVSEDCKSTHSNLYETFYLTLLKILTDNLAELHEHLLKPNLNLIRPELITFSRNQAVITKIKWLVLPSDLHVVIPVYLIKQKSGNLWNYISDSRSELKNIVMSHYQLILEDRYKEAENLLKNHLEHESSINYSVDFESKTEKTDSITKSSKDGLIKKFMNRLKNTNRYKKTVPSATTVPINPQDDLFRLAMLSEGPPGTLAESEGIRAFVLVDEFLIGRDKMICDLVLPQSTVGRVHARISRHGSHYFLEDLGSANGTTLDDKKLNKHQTYLLPDQCRLKFAERAFYFHVE